MKEKQGKITGFDHEILRLLANTFPDTRGEEFDLTNLMYQIAIERKKCNLPITAEYLKWLCIEIKKQNKED